MKPEKESNALVISDEAVLMLGSNEGNKMQFFNNAKDLINKRAGLIISQSSLYESEAWGNVNQAPFLNQVIILRTTLTPLDLLNELLKIEQCLGRTRSVKWAPRTIDIDILFYGSRVVQLENLQIPHPRIHDRKFTLIPLAELIPGFIHPVFQKTIHQLNDQCIDNLLVMKKKPAGNFKDML